MSQIEQTDVQCPTCGHSQSVTVWHSLNADIDPEAREELLAGRINVFQCERCDCQVTLTVSLLYNDMTRQFMAQYHPFDALEDPEFFRDYNTRGESVAAVEGSKLIAGGGMDYMVRVHVVFLMSELIRYIVFRERLHAHHQR